MRYIVSTLALLSATLVTAQTPDTLLMVFEVIRHGARYGLHDDYFNETSPSWRPGELTQNGRRQQYLLGTEMRNKYMVQNKLIDFTFNPDQIHVRSTDINRTVESAMSQLLALYPTGHSIL